MVRPENPVVLLEDNTYFSPEITPEDGSRLVLDLAALAMLATNPIEAAAETDRSTEAFRVWRNPDTYEVSIDSSITLEDYRGITAPEDMALLEQQAEGLRGKKVVFINPTLEGGGVAMLRPPLIHLLRQLGVDAHWYVMDGRKKPDDPNPFDFTKLMHNISQRRMPADVRITEGGKAVHWRWNTENAEVLLVQDTILTADIIIPDDPQPAPLIRGLQAANPQAKIISRNHIDTSYDLIADPTTPQSELARYLLDECGMRGVDAIVTHPVDAFMYPGMEDKTFFAPATVEPFDDLNRALTETEINDGLTFINSEISAKNLESAVAGHPEDLQALVDPTQRRIILVARFDESKGMHLAMELGVRTREKMRAGGVAEAALPQVIIVGNGSVDDPSGVPMFEKMMKLRREKYPDEMEGIILMRLKHNYKAMNALMYPSSAAGEASPAPVIGIQTSEAEGCETRISDWIRHGIPVVVANRGGMPLQVVEGQSGFILDFGKPDFDLDHGANLICEQMTDAEKYAALCRTTLSTAETFNNRDFTTVANTIRWMRIFTSVLNGTPADKHWKLDDLAGQKLLQAS